MLGSALLAGGVGAAEPPAVVLSLEGDWQLSVTVRLDDGAQRTQVVRVAPTKWQEVHHERHDDVPLFNPRAGGWAKGARLLALRAQECTTRHLLDPASLVLQTERAAGGTRWTPGKDYEADLEWGTFGRLPGGAWKEGAPVYASYRHGLLRLDSIVLTADRRIEIRTGEASTSAPSTPALLKGERRLANIWLPGVQARLGNDNLFPVLESAFPESPVEVPSPAERLIPRTLAKLRAGQPVRVLAWGDSVTDGGYLPGGQRERWQELFVGRLRERYPGARIELITEAWGGRNTDSYLAEPPGSEHHYEEKVLARRPDLIVSEFVNDAGLSEAQVEARYGKLLADFRQVGAEWIILTPHYVRPDWMGLGREREIDEDPRPYVAGLREFAVRHRVALADASRRYGRLWRQGIPYTTWMLNSINHPDVRGMTLFVDSLMALFPGGAPEAAGAWEFNEPGDLEGWMTNRDLADVSVTNGVLAARACGSDPILEYGRPLDVPADPWDVVELRLKADHDGLAELFWSNTSTGRYGGFAQEKSTRFPVLGDNSWRTYRLRPFWHPEGRIIRLRLDVYDAAAFELDFIRIVKTAVAIGPVEPAFDFAAGAGGWRGEDGAQVTPLAGGLRVVLADAAGLAVAPPVVFEATGHTQVSMCMAVDRGHHATLLFATAGQSGLQRHSFPIQADGRKHTYNVDLSAARGWGGRLIALGLRPSDEQGAVADLQWLRASRQREGGAELSIRSFGLEDVPARVGGQARLAVRVVNDGGEAIEGLGAELRLPEGAKGRGPGGGLDTRLGPGKDVTLRWWVTSRRPVTGSAGVVVRAANASPAAAECWLEFSRPPQGVKRGYVPQPRPVRGPYDVGVYYFPGWPGPKPWQPLLAFPERRPVLGWYREGDPEVADWHIKWAVEHGITFFIYDWYWVQGRRQLEHGLHEGYLKARYRSLLKFCLLWANHNPPGTSSREDCLQVARYWIQNYFRQPEHLTLEGKPAVVIFAPENLTQDLGGPEQVRQVLDAMRQECKWAGLKGLYFLARVNDAAQARLAAAEGYDAVTSYNWPHLGVPAGEFRAPFATLLEGYRRQWKHILDTADITLIPPLCGGWDSRPWHGENNFIRFGRTPALFEQHVRDARAFLDDHPQHPRLRNMLIIEAWNEWGEGSYIEPHAEYGFGYLDAVRNALTRAPVPHEDVVPADVGRGPYDVPGLESP